MLCDEIVTIKVWGPWALFTRPELKVERMSYPVMTPSAARGVLDAILFKKVTHPKSSKLVPAFHWHIRQISVLKTPSYEAGMMPYRLVGVRRNEINDKIAPANVKKWMKQPNEFAPYFVDSAGRESAYGANRVQRNSMVLRDVAYLIDASLDMQVDLPDDPPKKYYEMFARRLAKGQCFHRPYLGCREFSCDFAPGTSEDRNEVIDLWNDDLGLMLYDLRYERKGRKTPGFFQARIKNGVLHCDTAAPAPWGDPPIKIRGWEHDSSDGDAK